MQISRKVAEKVEKALFLRSRDASENQLSRLRWAVQFAQEPLEELTPGQKLDRRIALTVLFPAGFWGRESQVTIFKEKEMAQAHGQLHEMFRTWADKHRYTTVRPLPRMMVLWDRKEGLSFDFVSAKEAGYSEVDLLIGCAGLLLMGYGDRIRSCPAPAKRGKPGQLCGRLFVGTPNPKYPRYCSHTCQSRAGTTKHRPRKKSKGGLRHGKKAK